MCVSLQVLFLKLKKNLAWYPAYAFWDRFMFKDYLFSPSHEHSNEWSNAILVDNTIWVGGSRTWRRFDGRPALCTRLVGESAQSPSLFTARMHSSAPQHHHLGRLDICRHCLQTPKFGRLSSAQPVTHLTTSLATSQSGSVLPSGTTPAPPRCAQPATGVSQLTGSGSSLDKIPFLYKIPSPVWTFIA